MPQPYQHHGEMTLDDRTYNWLCHNSIERALKSTDPQDKRDLRSVVLELERAFRNATWTPE